MINLIQFDWSKWRKTIFIPIGWSDYDNFIFILLICFTTFNSSIFNCYSNRHFKSAYLLEVNSELSDRLIN